MAKLFDEAAEVARLTSAAADPGLAPTLGAHAKATHAPRASVAIRLGTRPVPKPATVERGERPTTDTSAAANTATHKTRQAVGGSHIGADFPNGLTSVNTTIKSTTAPAKAVGSEVKAALSSAISRQFHAHWEAPQGADADQSGHGSSRAWGTQAPISRMALAFL